jgi:hypothetical protein
MNIALIGNGESALLTKTGHLIDSCDMVVRLGLYKTSGYEEFIGSKTTICGTAKWKYIQPSPEITTWLVEDIQEEYDEELKDLLKYDEDIVTKGMDFKTYRPSIGTRFLHKLLKDYKDSTLYVKGFDFFSTGHYFDSAHSYHNSSHPIILEKRLFIKLVTSKTIHKI